LKKRPIALSIAGFDPSGGAGVLADVKTFEQHQVLGLGINTANTIQSHGRFENVYWEKAERIEEQLKLMIAEYEISFVKIGLIENLEVLEMILNQLKNGKQKVKIIWDPILKASSGFDFKKDLSALNSILKSIFLVTPNWQETIVLSGKKDGYEGAKALSSHCSVFFKGGHNQGELGKDYLYTAGKIYPYNSKAQRASEKHGSGCVLSASITANLAKGYPFQKACLRAKNYVTRYLESSPSLVGYHK